MMVTATTDNGALGRAIPAQGAARPRGDNRRFEFANFKVLPA